jgi:hypothetical protein
MSGHSRKLPENFQHFGMLGVSKNKPMFCLHPEISEYNNRDFQKHRFQGTKSRCAIPEG